MKIEATENCEVEIEISTEKKRIEERAEVEREKKEKRLQVFS
jgi:hypothetical protein